MTIAAIATNTMSEGKMARPPNLQVPHWSPITHVAFQFCFTYLGLYSLATQISGSLIVIPYVSFRGLGLLWPMREITLWIGERIFGIASLVYTGNSQDTNFF